MSRAGLNRKTALATLTMVLAAEAAHQAQATCQITEFFFTQIISD